MTQPSIVELLIGNLLTWFLIFIMYVAAIYSVAKLLRNWEEYLIPDMSNSEEDI